ncbi:MULTISPECIES: hydrolase [unclassified Sinorhizobium]|uniref:hydrolase n=1 Tax=unclassified Sinorhizobium TaxID=2613772 RepID=UPI0035249AE7
MLRRSLNHLQRPLSGIDLISTDVFDTLLLRQPKSRRSLLMAGERCFAQLLKEYRFSISAEELLRARLLAERFAYRALNTGGGIGEVRLTDVVSRQLAMLGLPPHLLERRLAIENAIEKASLSANGPLAMALRRHREDGIRIIAVSDTGLPTESVADLINHFHGPNLIDKIYASADVGASKRHGGLFSAVLEAEAVSPSSILHIGDDKLADCSVPASMGINTIHIPKGWLRRHASQADGARTEALRRFRRQLTSLGYRPPALGDDVSFGREVFGPIVAQFCLYIWLYALQADAQGNASLLFCARGGIGIRQAFERLLDKLGLPLEIRRDNILISRLIAARSALIRRSSAVLEELAREFKTNSFSEVAEALGSRHYQLPAPWQEDFVPQHFFAMLDTPSGREVLEDIGRQNALFIRHLEDICGSAERIILCDTGLYGSTQRLVTAGLPDRRFESIQFARCNYKDLSEEHFSHVTGLVVEENLYNPLKIETVILRYWQIIETLFEPAIPSVRHLEEAADGSINGNCGEIAYGKLDVAAGNPLLSGVLQYVDGVSSGADVMREADAAWRRLKLAITNPNPSDMVLLAAGPRSIDFGRSESVPVLNQSETSDIVHKLRSVKSQLWREGAIARDFPHLKSALLPALEMAHVVRGLTARLHKRMGRASTLSISQLIRAPHWY